MNPYLRSLRAPFLAGSMVPVLIGGAYALHEGRFASLPFVLCLLGVAALHLGANLINDYHDALGSDPVNQRLTPFSGGSRVIQEKAVSRSTVRAMWIGFSALALASGMVLVFMGRPLVAALGLLGLGIGWAYSAPPLQLMSRGLGEVGIFFAFGPLITLGTYYALAGEWSGSVFLLGVPHGFLIAEVIWINQFPDFEADRRAGKRNLVVRWGPSAGRFLYAAIMGLSFFSIVVLVFWAGFSPILLAAFAALPLGVRAVRILWREYLSHEGVVPAQAMTIQTLIFQGLLITLGLSMSRWLPWWGS